MVIRSSHVSSRVPSLAQRVSCKCDVQTRAPMYEREWKCPYCKTRLLDTLGDQAVTCHGWGDMVFAPRPARGQNFVHMQRCQTVASLRAKNLILETNSRPGDVCLTC